MVQTLFVHFMLMALACHSGETQDSINEESTIIDVASSSYGQVTTALKQTSSGIVEQTSDTTNTAVYSSSDSSKGASLSPVVNLSTTTGTITVKTVSLPPVFSGVSYNSVALLSAPAPTRLVQTPMASSELPSTILGASLSPVVNLSTTTGTVTVKTVSLPPVFSGVSYNSVALLSDPAPTRLVQTPMASSELASTIFGASLSPVVNLSTTTGTVTVKTVSLPPVFSGVSYDSVALLSDPAPTRLVQTPMASSELASTIFGASLSPVVNLSTTTGTVTVKTVSLPPVFSGVSYNSVALLSTPAPTRLVQTPMASSELPSTILGASLSPVVNLSTTTGTVTVKTVSLPPVFSGVSYNSVALLSDPAPTRLVQTPMASSELPSTIFGASLSPVVNLSTTTGTVTVKTVSLPPVFSGVSYNSVALLSDPAPTRLVQTPMASSELASTIFGASLSPVVNLSTTTGTVTVKTVSLPPVFSGVSYNSVALLSTPAPTRLVQTPMAETGRSLMSAEASSLATHSYATTSTAHPVSTIGFISSSITVSSSVLKSAENASPSKVLSSKISQSVVKELDADTSFYLSATVHVSGFTLSSQASYANALLSKSSGNAGALQSTKSLLLSSGVQASSDLSLDKYLISTVLEPDISASRGQLLSLGVQPSSQRTVTPSTDAFLLSTPSSMSASTSVLLPDTTLAGDMPLTSSLGSFQQSVLPNTVLSSISDAATTVSASEDQVLSSGVQASFQKTVSSSVNVFVLVTKSPTTYFPSESTSVLLPNTVLAGDMSSTSAVGFSGQTVLLNMTLASLSVGATVSASGNQLLLSGVQTLSQKAVTSSVNVFLLSTMSHAADSSVISGSKNIVLPSTRAGAASSLLFVGSLTSRSATDVIVETLVSTFDSVKQTAQVVISTSSTHTTMSAAFLNPTTVQSAFTGKSQQLQMQSSLDAEENVFTAYSLNMKSVLLSSVLYVSSETTPNPAMVSTHLLSQSTTALILPSATESRPVVSTVTTLSETVLFTKSDFIMNTNSIVVSPAVTQSIALPKLLTLVTTTKGSLLGTVPTVGFDSLLSQSDVQTSTTIETIASGMTGKVTILSLLPVHSFASTAETLTLTSMVHDTSFTYLFKSFTLVPPELTQSASTTLREATTTDTHDSIAQGPSSVLVPSAIKSIDDQRQTSADISVPSTVGYDTATAVASAIPISGEMMSATSAMQQSSFTAKVPSTSTLLSTSTLSTFSDTVDFVLSTEHQTLLTTVITSIFSTHDRMVSSKFSLSTQHVFGLSLFMPVTTKLLLSKASEMSSSTALHSSSSSIIPQNLPTTLALPTPVILSPDLLTSSTVLDLDRASETILSDANVIISTQSVAVSTPYSMLKERRSLITELLLTSSILSTATTLELSTISTEGDATLGILKSVKTTTPTPTSLSNAFYSKQLEVFLTPSPSIFSSNFVVSVQHSESRSQYAPDITTVLPIASITDLSATSSKYSSMLLLEPSSATVESTVLSTSLSVGSIQPLPSASESVLLHQSVFPSPIVSIIQLTEVVPSVSGEVTSEMPVALTNNTLQSISLTQSILKPSLLQLQSSITASGFTIALPTYSQPIEHNLSTMTVLSMMSSTGESIILPQSVFPTSVVSIIQSKEVEATSEVVATFTNNTLQSVSSTQSVLKPSLLQLQSLSTATDFTIALPTYSQLVGYDYDSRHSLSTVAVFAMMSSASVYSQLYQTQSTAVVDLTKYVTEIEGSSLSSFSTDFETRDSMLATKSIETTQDLILVSQPTTLPVIVSASHGVTSPSLVMPGDMSSTAEHSGILQTVPFLLKTQVFVSPSPSGLLLPETVSFTQSSTSYHSINTKSTFVLAALLRSTAMEVFLTTPKISETLEKSVSLQVLFPTPVQVSAVIGSLQSGIGLVNSTSAMTSSVLVGQMTKVIVSTPLYSPNKTYLSSHIRIPIISSVESSSLLASSTDKFGQLASTQELSTSLSQLQSIQFSDSVIIALGPTPTPSLSATPTTPSVPFFGLYPFGPTEGDAELLSGDDEIGICVFPDSGFIFFGDLKRQLCVRRIDLTLSCTCY